MNTEARLVALEATLEEAERDIDRLYRVLFRLLTVTGMPAPERLALLAQLDKPGLG